MTDFGTWRQSLDLKAIQQAEPELLEAVQNGSGTTKMMARSALLLVSADIYTETLYRIALERTK